MVKVVRCKDCKYCDFFYPQKEIGKEAISTFYCELFKGDRKETDFCSYGELKEREGVMMLSNGKVAKMPNELTDSEIVKALECCSVGTFACGEECSRFHSKSNLKISSCRFELIGDALDLINRLQAENERLKEEVKAHIKKSVAKRKYDRALIKSEAYKECIEKVKEKSCKLNMCHNDVVVKTDYQISGEALDNLLKELIGE